MNDKQLKFLTQVKEIAESKTCSSSVEDICNVKITVTHSRLLNFKQDDIALLIESLTTQDLLNVNQKKHNRIYRFTLTPKGLKELGSGLKLYGENIQSVNIEINTQLIETINKLVEEVKQSNIENKGIWLEIAEALKEEVNKENPKKNILALLIGLISNSVSFGANATTILTASGVTLEQIQNFIHMLISK